MARKKSSPSDEAEPRGLRLALSAPRIALGLTLGILLLALLLPSLVGETLERRFTVDSWKMEFDLEPVWLEAPARVEVEESLAGLGAVSLRDDDALAEWLTDLGECSPWILGVTSARKHYPDRLSVSFELRRPIARLQTSSGRVLLDEGGWSLGGEELAPDYAAHERPLVLYRRGPVADLLAGEVLAEPALRAGLEVIKEINPHLERLRRAGCDLIIADVTPLATDDPARRTDVTLFTSDGWYVEWGRARSLRADEPSPEAKIQHLLALREDAPPFEDVLGYCVQFHSRRLVSLVRSTGQHQVAAAGRVADSYGAPGSIEPEGTEPPR